MKYTFDDVTKLMRELPASKIEMVVVIVQKTLLSMRIPIQSIIDDARRKVDRMQKQSDILVSEIRAMEEAIILKKAEVDSLKREIDETTRVKDIFENVFDRHVKSDLPAKKSESIPVPPPKPGVGRNIGLLSS